jgi:hypothetical protein
MSGMKQNWPVWTLAALGTAVALDTLIIVLTSGPLACGGNDDGGSNLAAVFGLTAFVLLVGGPTTLILVGLREALTRRPVPVYVVITIGVPVIIALSGWAIGTAWGASWCGGSFMILGG